MASPFTAASSIDSFAWGHVATFSGHGRVRAAAACRHRCGIAVVTAGAGVVVVLAAKREVGLQVFRQGMRAWLVLRPWLVPCPGLSAGLQD